MSKIGCGLSAKPSLAVYPYSMRQSVLEVKLAMQVLQEKTGVKAGGVHIYGQVWAVPHFSMPSLPLSLKLPSQSQIFLSE